jgi:hypothetical protein
MTPPPPEGNPGQHVYTFVIGILLVTPQFQFGQPAAALGIYLYAPICLPSSLS